MELLRVLEERALEYGKESPDVDRIVVLDQEFNAWVEKLSDANEEKILQAIRELQEYATGMNDVPPQLFCWMMLTRHRTFQQNFTRLCLLWMEWVASDTYNTDDRNKQSHKVCKDMLDAWQEKFQSLKPKDYLPFI